MSKVQQQEAPDTFESQQSLVRCLNESMRPQIYPKLKQTYSVDHEIRVALRNY